MKQISSILILISILCFRGSAQVNENVCPKISLTAPNNYLYPERPVTFSAKVENEKQTLNLQYFWMISGGKIIKGQGESSLEFAATDEDSDRMLGIAVKIRGLPNNCPDTVSDFVVVAALPIGEPVEGFGKVSLNSYKTRIDSFLIAVKEYPDSEGLIEIKFNSRDSRNYKITLLKNIIKYLEFRKFDKKRITIAITEADFEQTELWIVPSGAKFPQSRTKDYKRVSEENYQILKAEEFTQKINDLCFRNASL